MKNYLNLFVSREYNVKKDGDTVVQRQYTQVGRMFPHKEGNGFNLEIYEGISVSGNLLAFPPKEKAENAPDAAQGGHVPGEDFPA